MEVIESPSWPPSGKFICGGITEILPFPPQLRPFVPDCPSNLVGGSAIDVWVAINRGVAGEDLKTAIPRRYTFGGQCFPKSGPAAETLIRFFNSASDPMPMKDIGGSCGRA